MYAFDASHLDIGCGGRARDCGDRDVSEFANFPDPFGHCLDNLVRVNDTEVVIGDKGQCAAAFVDRMSQHYRSSQLDSHYASCQETFTSIHLFLTQTAVADEFKGLREPFLRQILRNEQQAL